MIDDELEQVLRKALLASIERMAERAAEGTISAAEVRHLRELYKEAGGELLSFQGQPTPLGDDVLDSLKNLDPDFLN